MFGFLRKPKPLCTCCGRALDAIPLSFAAELPLRTIGLPAPAQPIVSEHDLYAADSEHFFIRGTIELPIIGTDHHFAWGVWCSLSPASYEAVKARWAAPDRASDEPRFGWLLADLRGYPTTTWQLKTRVHQRALGVVPLVEIEPESHAIAIEQRDGISVERWHKLAAAAFAHSPH